LSASMLSVVAPFIGGRSGVNRIKLFACY
jgi:hypothetical protein